MSTKHFLANFFIFLCFIDALSSSDIDQLTIVDQNGLGALQHDDNKCVYTVYIRTSKTIKGGTDSIISVEFYDRTGSGVRIKDLTKWGGVMEKGHDYYERGNLDIFTGRGPCLDRRVCSMTLKSDGTGWGHGWYCNYVEVTTTGPHMQCGQQLFTVEQWLATDHSPYELTAVRNNCGNVRGRTTLLPVETLLRVT